MTLGELQAGLESVLNNVVFGLLLSRLVTPEDWAQMDPPVASFQGTTGDVLRLDLSPMRARMTSPEYRKAVTEEFETCLKRATVREGHELLLQYCEETGQFTVYRSQSWFQFARIIRNVVSHKDAGRLRRWPEDLRKAGQTDVTWRHHILRESDVGSPVTFTLHDALQLLKDQIDFAKTGLV